MRYSFVQVIIAIHFTLFIHDNRHFMRIILYQKELSVPLHPVYGDNWTLVAR